MKRLLPHIWLIIALGVFVFASQFEPFADEFDVLLGGQYILDGQLLYTNYFSHHLPLPYFFAAGLEWITFDNLPVIRVLWSLCLFGLLLLNYQFIERTWNRKLANVFVFLQLVLIFCPHNYFFSLKSDSISAHFVVMALLRLMGMIEKSLPRFDKFVFLVSLAVVVHSSLSLLPLSLFLFVLFLVFDKDLSTKNWWQTFVFFVVVFVLDLIIFRNQITAIISQIFEFNQLYYSAFNAEFPIPIGPFLSDKLLRLEHTVLDFIQHIYKPNHWLFIFRLAVVISGLWMMFKSSKKLFVLFTGTLILCALRGGFYSNFNDNFGFHQLPLMMVMALVCLWLFHQDQNTSGFSLAKISLYGYVMLLFGVAGLGGIRYVRTLTIYHGTDTTLDLSVDPALEDFLNQNNHKDSTWVLPFAMREMYLYRIQNQMKYQYYLPWHAVCLPCNEGIEQRLNQTPPKYILWNPDENIWGFVSSEYGKPLKKLIEHRYHKTGEVGAFEVWEVDSELINNQNQ